MSRNSRPKIQGFVALISIFLLPVAAIYLQSVSGTTLAKQWPPIVETAIDEDETYFGPNNNKQQDNYDTEDILDGRSETTAAAAVAASASVSTTTTNATSGGGFVGKLSRSAPYAIETSNNGQNMKNIVFRLAATSSSDSNNQTGGNQQESTIDDDPWTFVTKNGTLIGSKANYNLKKLLETLDSNNFTSEVKFDEKDSRFVNITISNLRDSDKIDAMLLEEIILDASSEWSNLLNGSSILKDNHRYESTRHRTRPPVPSELISSITSPPLRSTIEVVAENYTQPRVSEEANNFAIKLLHQLNIEKLGNRNLIHAPFSVYQGLALLLMGAQGESAKEMDKALLGSQSTYENTKLTHDPDRPRLLASFSDVVRQLHHSATHHLRPVAPLYNDTGAIKRGNRVSMSPPYVGGTSDQHLIVANNLLFSPSAYEISPEFREKLNTYFNNSATLTKIEIGSTESIQVVNSWIRAATAGVIPAILNKRSTFDEFTVMALLCTSWLSQEWRDPFYRVSSPLRTSVRLKGQARALAGGSFMGGRGREWNLLEFVDDNKQSHFVDYIKSKPTTNIHHYHSVLNGLIVDVVVVPFRDSNHRLITLTPVSSSSNNATQQLSEALIGQIGTASAQVLLSTAAMLNQTANNNGQQQQNHPQQQQKLATELPDSSLLTRLIGAFAINPRKTMRSLWNIVAPEIITKHTMQQSNSPYTKGYNSSNDDDNDAESSNERTLEANEPPLVQLSIPIIRSEADSSISAALNHIGIVNAFDPNQANFIGINGHPFNYYKLHLSNVISKTTFNLNERGLNYDKTIRTLESLRVFPERQQSTNDYKTSSSTNNDFKPELVDDVKLDKPFMYFICDIKTKLILYTGVLRNPEQEGS